MGNYIEGKSRFQAFLFPPRMEDWIPEDHSASVIDRFIESLDIFSLKLVENNDESGRSRYSPLVMLKILIYSYSIGVRSNREIERLTYENVAIRWLSCDLHPDYRTVARFRSEKSEVLKDLLTETVKLYCRLDLEERGFEGVVFVDGTKMYANSSIDSVVDLERIEKRVERILKEAELIDEEEDEKYGKDGSGGGVRVPSRNVSLSPFMVASINLSNNIFKLISGSASISLSRSLTFLSFPLGGEIF